MTWWLYAYMVIVLGLVGYATYRYLRAERKAEAARDAHVKAVQASMHHMTHYVGDTFAAQVLRLAAEDLDSVEGQTELRTLGFDHKIGGRSLVSRWLHARADRLIPDEEETS